MKLITCKLCGKLFSSPGANTCPKCMKRIKQEVELNPINSKFSWYENPCEMCGSHGNLSYDPGICTHCKLVWPSITIDKF